MRGWVLAVIGALVIVAGCGRVPGSPTPAGDYKLYEAATTSTSTQLSVIDSASHAIELNMPLGTPSPDWAHLYTTNANTLVDLDPQTGSTLHSSRMPGSYQLPPATLSGVPGGLSQNGQWLVLQSFDATSGRTPTATHLLIVDTSYAKAMRQIDLPGYFQFDAVSNDGNRIFLIQYISDTEYYVRRFDVGSGQLNPAVIFDKKDGGAAMAGLRLSGVASPDGHWLFSVYARQDKSPFIHALSLDDSLIALCLDLPGSGYSSSSDAFHWSLAMSPNGYLYAANGAMGVVSEVDTNSLSVVRNVRIAGGQPAPTSMLVQNVEAKEFGANGAVLSPDGGTLVLTGKTGLVWVDTASLKAHDQQLGDWTVWSLAMSPDGSTVYAVNDGGMIAEVPMTGSHTAKTFSGAPGQPLSLIRVAAVRGS